jgi:hypothetical protein
MGRGPTRTLHKRREGGELNAPVKWKKKKESGGGRD